MKSAIGDALYALGLCLIYGVWRVAMWIQARRHQCGARGILFPKDEQGRHVWKPVRGKPLAGDDPGEDQTRQQ